MTKPKYAFIALLFTLLSLASCTTAAPPTLAAPALATEITLYNWVDYVPQSVLDAFTAEYGVKVNYVTFDTLEEAVQAILEGTVDFDIAVTETDAVARLVAGNALYKIDYRHLPNFANISANFRDLAYDPANRYFVPYNWGTTGFLVRSDLVGTPPKQWADLWEPRFAGRIALRQEPAELIAIALKSLGYSINSADPAQLQAALARLLQLMDSATLVDADSVPGLATLISGEDWILVGYPGDELVAHQHNPAITYTLPEDGTLLWGDGFVISAKSKNQYTAELFINFVLRPEISAKIVEEYRYPTANESALALLDPTIRNDLTLFPTTEDIHRGEWYIAPNPEIQKIYQEITKHLELATP